MLLPAPASAAGGAPLLDHLLDSPQLLDDPGGARTWLATLGVRVDAYFNHTLGANVRGGIDKAVRNSGSADYFLRLDLEELGLLPAANLLVKGKSSYNRNVNPDVGALSDPIDDADFDETIYLAYAWYEQALFRDRVVLRLGYLDQQVAFDRNAYANSEDTQFLATFLDNDNAIVPLKVGFGANVFLRPTRWLALALGTADADNVPLQAGFDTAFDNFESLMGYFEATFRAQWPSPRGPLPGSYRFGFFYDGSRKTVFGEMDAMGLARRERGHLGAYASFDQLVYRESAEDGQGLGLFFRWGIADPDVNRIEHFWSAGLHYQGLLPWRDRDVVGAGAYQAIVSDRYRDRVEPDADRETGLELYYRIAVTPWLDVTPDFQLVIDPGGLDPAADAVVLALRFRVSL